MLFNVISCLNHFDGETAKPKYLKTNLKYKWKKLIYLKDCISILVAINQCRIYIKKLEVKYCELKFFDVTFS